MGQARRRKQAGTYPDRVQLREWEESVLAEWHDFHKTNDGTRTEVGAIAHWSPDRTRVLITAERVITIAELEQLAQAGLAEGEPPIVSAPRFETPVRTQRLPNGKTALSTVLIHPDPRAQALLEEMREGAFARVIAETEETKRQLLAAGVPATVQ